MLNIVVKKQLHTNYGFIMTKYRSQEPGFKKHHKHLKVLKYFLAVIKNLTISYNVFFNH